jgi:hypothetical protein
MAWCLYAFPPNFRSIGVDLLLTFEWFVVTGKLGGTEGSSGEEKVGSGVRQDSRACTGCGPREVF